MMSRFDAVIVGGGTQHHELHHKDVPLMFAQTSSTQKDRTPYAIHFANQSNNSLQ